MRWIIWWRKPLAYRQNSLRSAVGVKQSRAFVVGQQIVWTVPWKGRNTSRHLKGFSHVFLHHSSRNLKMICFSCACASFPLERFSWRRNTWCLPVKERCYSGLRFPFRNLLEKHGVLRLNLLLTSLYFQKSFENVWLLRLPSLSSFFRPWNRPFDKLGVRLNAFNRKLLMKVLAVIVNAHLFWPAFDVVLRRVRGRNIFNSRAYFLFEFLVCEIEVTSWTIRTNLNVLSTILVIWRAVLFFVRHDLRAFEAVKSINSFLV